jgi:hypothetical protein
VSAEEPAPDPLPVPAGSPEDQALWKATGDVGNELTSLRFTGNALHWKIKTDDLHARLQGAAKADPAAAKRLDEIRKQLAAAQAASYADLAGKWPIDPTRACQYDQMHLGSAIEVAATRGDQAQLGPARAAATRCLELGKATLVRVKRSTEELARAVTAAEDALAAAASAGK